LSRIVLSPSGQSIDCRDGDTVLSALEAAGYAYPNNCRAGACGECKVKVLAGEFAQGLVLDMALTGAERAAGFGLMCMAKPLSAELVIDWGAPDARPKLFPPRENMPFVVVDKLPRTPLIVELKLRPLGEPMRYWPGQHVLVRDGDGRRPARSYSLAAAPRPDGELTLQVTRIGGGATSPWIHDDLAAGDVVTLSGPFGTFVGDPTVETPVLCLAAGSGLAPILSLAEAALRRGFALPVTLLFSARTPEHVYESGLLRYWERRYRNFRFLTTFTRSRTPSTEGSLSGRIPAVLPSLFPDLSRHSVFVAGSPEFVADCVAAAKALGANERLLHTEGFFAQSEAGAGAGTSAG
jgi:CDP-4-dehydro-6-deoxyglucose reductase